MKKKGILLAVVILLGTVGFVQAQEGESALHGTIDVTYLSKYVWRGFDIYGDKSAIRPSIDLDLFGTGFGVSVAAHRANSSGFEDGERWDYALYYQNSLFEEETYATNYRLSWIHYNFPDSAMRDYDLDEIQAFLSWPKICPAGVVPSYVLVKLWPTSSGSKVGSRSPFGGTASGWAHIFMLDYPWTVENLLPEIPEQVFNIHSEFVYNDGVGPGGQNVDQDWSNMVVGISTDFDLGNSLTFTPGVYHQVTMDDSVNDDKDETWVSLGMRYTF
jgi:hypothetical protein